MIQIKGSVTQATVYSDTLDAASEGLIKALCGSILSESSTIRVMPDVHPGKGCAIGLTMTLNTRAAPGLVGTDIGCGMEIFKVKAKRLELMQLDKLIQSKIPSGAAARSSPHRFCERIDLSSLVCADRIAADKAQLGIGTLGGGNHFIELDKSPGGEYYLVIHSGSRRLGAEVEKHYHELAYKYSSDKVPYEFAYLEGELLENYLHDVKITQSFAAINRQAIASEIIRGMKFDVIESFSAVHNYIDTDKKILRKGAVSANAGEKLIIPLNMRDGCLLCTGKGNAEWNFSAPHGAGRAYSRAEALSSFTLSQYKKEMKNVYSSSVGKATLDECPMAYKPPEAIVDAISPTAEITERLTPVYNFKAGIQ